jgi:hypothetical protein
MRLNDEAFNEATQELEEITVDFIENHGMSMDEFNGMTLAQIVRFYIHNDEFDHIRKILSDVLKSIDEIESGERFSKINKFIKDQDEDEQ